MRGNVWTDDGITLLRKLWAEGATANAIGQRLGGFSRSAVLGKVFRLRLNCESDSAVPIKPAPSEPDGPGRRRRRQPRRPLVARPVKRPGRFTLFDLSNESCRWPYGRRGKFFFCGVAEADVLCGIPYCARHMRRAYTDAVSFEKSRRGEVVHNVDSPNIGARA
jgi:GcrA cell cycle regulator